MPTTAATNFLKNSPAEPDDLAALRAELDRIDDGLYELLAHRAEVVVRLAASVRKGPVALRPGREAAIIRRLTALRAGPLDALAVVRIWRELFAATTALQGEHAIAVCDPSPDLAYVQIAREHFGALTPLRRCPGAAEALAEVREGRVTAAVLPWPLGDEDSPAPWWTTLPPHAGTGVSSGDVRLHIVARLPFWASPRPEGAPGPGALVVCAVEPDPSGDDRTILALQASPATSPSQLAEGLVGYGFRPGPALLHREAGRDSAQALVDVEGFVTEADPRLEAMRTAGRSPFVLGAYAVPIGDESV